MEEGDKGVISSRRLNDMLKVMRTFYAHDKFQFLGKEGKGLEVLNEDQCSDYFTENCLRIILNALNWQKLVEWQEM